LTIKANKYSIRQFLVAKVFEIIRRVNKMYAVIRTGGKQYKVQENQALKIEKLDGTQGASVQFDDVLLYSDGESITIGTPNIDNAVVKAHISDQGKSKKTIVFKHKRRKNYRRMKGHRQEYTEVYIDSIALNNGKSEDSRVDSAAIIV
jgi:large subunit ribosomal protein L21